MTINLDSSAIDALVKTTLSEDIQNGDITTRNIFHDEKNAVAEVIALEPMVLCGLEIFKAIFKELTTKVAFTSFEYNDGDEITAEETIIKIQCGAIPLLEGERSALNILQWLSGIATLTRKFVKKAAPVKVLDTRKTTPGLRIFEKYAVKCGGGTNHRFGLYDQVLIKDNHIEAAGSITNAMNHVRKNVNQDKKLEIEVKNLKEVKEAINNEADIIMLDNMSIETIKKSISLINGKSKIEISGGVTYDKLAEISKTGADYVSVGALTHSAPAVDISMKITSL
tara:strand:- start:495 stop:1340 length:846 start_codon:yes stop_codon:yes gene_type:complete